MLIMPSPTEPLFLLDPDSPRFHHFSEPNGMSIRYSSHVDILTILLEPSAAASPKRLHASALKFMFSFRTAPRLLVCGNSFYLTYY
jgi:hypothetical protein